MTRILCAVGMRNAKLRNHLKEDEVPNLAIRYFLLTRGPFDFPENESFESCRASRGGLGHGTSWSSGTQLLVVAVCACALHAQLQTTNVEINVYFPGGFLRTDSRVFLSSENNNEVRVISNDTLPKINVFGKYMPDLLIRTSFSRLLQIVRVPST